MRKETDVTRSPVSVSTGANTYATNVVAQTLLVTIWPDPAGRSSSSVTSDLCAFIWSYDYLQN